MCSLDICIYRMPLWHDWCYKISKNTHMSQTMPDVFGEADGGDFSQLSLDESRGYE